MTIDFTDANIYHLFIHTDNSKLQISLGTQIMFLTLSGTLENFEMKECQKFPIFTFYPNDSIEKNIYQLSTYQSLQQITCLNIHHSPAKKAFDCASLLQFQNLKSLHLNGNMMNLGVLTQLKQLENIELRYIPNLSDMPELRSWKHLKSFIGYNIEENVGKQLRGQLNQIKKEKTMGYSSITKLRKPIWFVTEYGIPFSTWEDKNAKKATTAYKNCFHKIMKSQSEDEVRESVVEFIQKINKLKNIETTEREDVYTAISQLIEHSSFDIPLEKWSLWFDETRYF